MEITFINVGYGESILITYDDPTSENGQFVMLIDGGSNMDSEYVGNSGRIRALEFLKKKQIRHIDLLVFSHVHEDHTSGLVPIISEIPVKRLWTSLHLSPQTIGRQISPDTIPSETNRKAILSINAYSTLMQELAQKNITWLDGIKPGYFQNGDLLIDVLGPEINYKRTVEASMEKIFTAESSEALDAAITETTESMNNASLILRLHYKGKKVLLCGDTNAGGFRHLLPAHAACLKADVFKIGHHGQPDSVSDTLLRIVDPSVIVCCASNDYRSNSSSSQTMETISRVLGDKPVTYLFQDGLYNGQWNTNTAPRNGVTLHIDDESIRWELCQDTMNT